jgi:hypothetical protein
VGTLVTVVVGLGAGLIGVSATIVYNRGAELRSRMIEAADAFLTASIPALIDLNEAAPTIISASTLQIFGAKAPDQALRDLHAAVKELELRLARVQLLFGPDSARGKDALAVTSRLRDATNMLEYIRVIGTVDEDHLASTVAAFNEEQHAMNEAHERFGPSARQALIPWWDKRRPPTGPSA